jgi:hypothetical protein
MLKRRYEILLPLKFNDGRPIPDELFYETRENLLARFEGLTWVAHPIEGMWKHEGITYHDATVRLVVDVDDTPENHGFITELKPVLLKRFDQLEIYIISYPIERI